MYKDFGRKRPKRLKLGEKILKSCDLVQCVSILLVTEESRGAVAVLHTARLPVAAEPVTAVTFPDAAVVVPEVAAGVVRKERGGEDVSVGAGVVATDVDVGVLAGVVVPPAGSLPLPAPLLGVTLVLAEALQLPPAGVAVEAVLTVRVLDTANLAVATLVTAVTPPGTAPTGAGEVQEVAVVSLH